MRRLAENQLYFKRPNEKVQESFEELEDTAQEHNDKNLLKESDPIIGFYCECSDENCEKRIRIRPSKYGALHKNSNQFIILPGHNVPEIEKIIKSYKSYVVVEKYIKPKINITKLWPTELENN